MLITCLLLVLEIWDGNSTYRKSWAGNHLAWSDLTLDPFFKVKRGQPNLKVLITRLLLVLEVLVHCLYGGYNLHRFSDALGLVYYTFNKSHRNSFILLVFSHVANFKYVAKFRFLTLHIQLKEVQYHLTCFIFTVYPKKKHDKSHWSKCVCAEEKPKCLIHYHKYNESEDKKDPLTVSKDEKIKPEGNTGKKSVFKDASQCSSQINGQMSQELSSDRRIEGSKESKETSTSVRNAKECDTKNSNDGKTDTTCDDSDIQKETDTIAKSDSVRTASDADLNLKPDCTLEKNVSDSNIDSRLEPGETYQTSILVKKLWHAPPKQIFKPAIEVSSPSI